MNPGGVELEEFDDFIFGKVGPGNDPVGFLDIPPKMLSHIFAIFFRLKLRVDVKGKIMYGSYKVLGLDVSDGDDIGFPIQLALFFKKLRGKKNALARNFLEKVDPRYDALQPFCQPFLRRNVDDIGEIELFPEI